jgi:FAD/FMN-containing dehydrogenase
MRKRLGASRAAGVPTLTDATGLAQALRGALHGEVRFDQSSRALYATDGSNYRQVPIGVVLPRHNDDVIAAVSLCREFNAPLLCRGGGTSLAGQCCNVAVVLDFSRYMNQILEIDPARRIARVQPGVVLDTCATPPKNIISPSLPIPPATTAALSAA